jgi:hypothetical protein
MKYCAACNKITPGEPLFCQFCGCSFDCKLCPRLHPNPRSAEICSRCGSRDLSRPAPRVPWWAHVIEVVIPVISGLALAIGSLGATIIAITAVVENPGLIVSLIFLSIAFGILWAMWSELPTWLRTAIYRILNRLRKRRTESRRDQ